jgi:hypothetical protein
MADLETIKRDPVLCEKMMAICQFIIAEIEKGKEEEKKTEMMLKTTISNLPMDLTQRIEEMARRCVSGEDVTIDLRNLADQFPKQKVVWNS